VNFATAQGRLLRSPGAHVDGVLLGFGRRGRQKDANAVGRILVGPSAISPRLGSLELLNPPLERVEPRARRELARSPCLTSEPTLSSKASTNLLVGG
jgi:hypothetical protein